MATTILSHNRKDQGLRPLRPGRDLLGVADLIEEAFSADLDRAGYSALREMRLMGRLAFLAFFIDFFDAESPYLNGFVWVDEGRIVGNTTVSRSSSSGREWFISNVAVTLNHRGRGYARQLMDAAVEYARQMGGVSVSLQVKRGNDPAVALYQSMGFKPVSSVSQFRLTGAYPLLPAKSLPEGVTLRAHRLNGQDSYAAYVLAREMTPAKVQRERPVYESRYRLGTETAFYNFWRGLTGRAPAKHWVVEDQPGRFAAVLTIEPGDDYAEYKMSLLVHPNWWGKLEDALISMGLNYLHKYSPQVVIIEHSEYHPDGIEALLRAGFKERHTHIWMKLLL